MADKLSNTSFGSLSTAEAGSIPNSPRSSQAGSEDNLSKSSFSSASTPSTVVAKLAHQPKSSGVQGNDTVKSTVTAYKPGKLGTKWGSKSYSVVVEQFGQSQKFTKRASLKLEDGKTLVFGKTNPKDLSSETTLHCLDSNGNFLGVVDQSGTIWRSGGDWVDQPDGTRGPKQLGTVEPKLAQLVHAAYHQTELPVF